MSETAILRRIGGAGVYEAPEPPLPSNSDWVQVLRAGVCGTDIQIARGERPQSAPLLGHEAVGAVGGDSRRLVVFNPVDLHDQDHILGHDSNGVFRSTFPLDRSSSWPQLVAVPGHLSLNLAALCEPVATALYSWELIGGADRPQRVGIWGAGPMGLLHSYLALTQGMSVLLVHPDEIRLCWANQRLFGDAVHCSPPGALRGGPELDLAFLCTDRAGAPAAFEEAIGALKPRGVLVLVGGIPREYQTPLLPGVDLDAVRRGNACGRRGGGLVAARTSDGKPLAVTGHRGSSADQILAAHTLISGHQQFFDSLVTHVVDPRAAVQLINQRCAGRQRDESGAEIVKVVVRFGELA